MSSSNITGLGLRLQRNLSAVSSTAQSAQARLASSSRIVTASDDAAGLSIASSLKADSRIYTQGIRNLNDGISFLTIAEGALKELNTVVIRQKELAEQSANGTLSDRQRRALQKESDQLTAETNRILVTTTFNGQRVFSSSINTVTYQAGYGGEESYSSSLGSGLSTVVGDGTFATMQSTGSGNYARYVTTVDHNQDGRTDLLVSEAGTSELVLMLGNANGTFSRNVINNAMIGPAISADFNNDKILDVAVAGSSAGSLYVYRGNSNNTFSTGVLTSLGGASQVFSGKAADLNNDGKQDLVVVSIGDNYSKVLLGNGDGSFALAGTYSEGTAPRDVELSDLNDDGILDMVVATSTSNEIRVRLGSGGGNFGTATSIATGGNVQDISIADLNRDGVDDIISSGSGEGIRLRLGNGNGTFAAGALINSSASAFHVVTDLNGDGLEDLVFNDNYLSLSTGLNYVFGNGDGTFSSAAYVAGGTNGWMLAAGDFNGDGAQDLVNGVFDPAVTGVRTYFGNDAPSTVFKYLNINNQENARRALSDTTNFLTRITNEIATIGASQSAMEVRINTLGSRRENIEAAASRITDVDVAQEAGQLVRATILQQLNASLLPQAISESRLLLDLLR